MRDIKIKLEKDFLLYQFSEETIAGMTFKTAGNYFTADKIFATDILQYLKLEGMAVLKNRLITVSSNNTSNKVVFFKSGLSAFRIKFSPEGIIYRGIGGIIYFPAGCPVVIFHDEKSNLSGAMHAGWKAIGAGILDSFTNLWEKQGGHKGFETKIQILPALCQKCLNYDIDFFFNVIKPAINLISQKVIVQFIKINEKRIGMDLSEIILYLLKQKGYLNLKKAHECLCCSGRYWCYRCNDKDGKKYRNAAFIITAPFSFESTLPLFL